MSKTLKASLRKTIVGIVMMTTIFSLSGVAALVPTAQAATYVTGDLIRNPSAAGDAQFDVYVAKVVGTKMFKRLILNPAIFNSYGGLFKWANVKLISTDEMNQFKTSALVRVETDPKVLALQPAGDTGSKSWMNVSAADFIAAGGDWDSVYVINSIDGAGYAAAADLTTQTQVNTFLTAGTLPGVSPTPAPGAMAPLSVALSAATPVAANIQIGSANNTVTKVQFAASATADTSISGLTVKSFGTANLNVADIALVKIFDGGTQVGLSQAMVNGTANFVFTPAVKITMGTVKELSIVVSMAVAGGAATPSATVKMGIESAAKITGATFTGTFPVVGNAMTEVAGGALGILNVAAGAVVPVNQTYVGALNVVLGNFTVSAGTNEDINANQVNVSYNPAPANAGASIQDSDIANVHITIDGVAVGGSATFSSRRATISLSPVVPFVKGTSHIVQVLGDIASGAARTVELQAAVDAVSGVGVTSGAGIAGPAAAVNLGLGNDIVIAAGNISVSVSTASPQGTAANVVISTTPQTLGVFDVRATGEDMLVSNVNVGVVGAGAAGTITNVGLYNASGALLSQLVNLVGAGGLWGPAAGTNFVVSWTVPANTTAQLYVKGTTAGITNVAAPVAVALVNNLLGATRSVIATGMSSSGQAGPNNITLASVLALPAITVNQAGTFALVGDNTLTRYNQAIVGPSSQAEVGQLKITANNENQRFRDAVLRGITSAGTITNYLTSVALYDGTTQITNFIAPGPGALLDPNGGAVAGTDVYFDTANVIVPTTFTQGVPKSLRIVANIISPLPAEGTTLQWSLQAVTNRFRTTGAVSGVVATSGAAGIANFQVNVGAFNAGGLYTFRSNVLEIAQSATSPSGTIDRRTFANAALFDLNAKGGNVNLGIPAITFTSTVGLPAGLVASVVATGVLNDATMFRLYDIDNAINIPATRFLNVTNGTITFSGIANGLLTVNFGVTRHIALQVTTTDLGKWPAGTSMRWQVQTANSVVVGSIGTLVAAGPDLGTAVAAQTGAGAGVAGVSGRLQQTSAAGAAFVLGTDGAYLDNEGGGLSVSIGDVRIAIGADAARGLGFTPGSIVKALDADIGTVLALPVGAVANQLRKTGGAGNLFVYGTDAAYIQIAAGAGALVAGDTRLMYGNAGDATGNTMTNGINWQGGVGFGGTTYSIPAGSNTISL